MNNNVIFIIAKCNLDFACVLADYLKERSYESYVFCGPDRFAYRKIQYKTIPNIKFDLESIRNKNVTVFAIDHTSYEEAIYFSLYLDQNKIFHRKIIYYLDIPTFSFIPNEYDVYFKDSWNVVFARTKEWEIIVRHINTEKSLKEYANKDSIGILNYPIFYCLPQEIDIDSDFVVCCGRIGKQKRTSEIIELMSCRPDLFLYLIGNGDNLQYYEDLAVSYKVKLKIFSNISEQDKYNLIDRSVFTVYGENIEDIGGLGPIEGFALSKVACVWDTSIHRHLYQDLPLYAKTKDDFIYNIKIADKIQVDKEKYKLYVKENFSWNYFTDKFVGIING